MFDFVVAGVIYLLVMFIVFFCFSFVTIGITYMVAVVFRRCLSWMRQPNLAIK